MSPRWRLLATGSGEEGLWQTLRVASETPLVAAWSAVAPGYLDYWIPRFRPYLDDALAAFDQRLRAPGELVIPGCGPGEEVVALARRHPGRRLVALDPSGPMLELLRARLAREGLAERVRVVQAPAEATSAHVQGAAGLFSSFTLQLLDRPIEALADWGRALCPGGVGVILFWPRQAPDTPWGQLRASIEAEGGAWGVDWEAACRADLGRVGMALTSDAALRHPMRHASAQEAWDRLVDACSLQSTARRLGPEAMARCRERWLAGRAEGPLEHHPTARLWSFTR
jgi:SAM-dependent methyltransferase